MTWHKLLHILSCDFHELICNNARFPPSAKDGKFITIFWVQFILLLDNVFTLSFSTNDILGAGEHYRVNNPICSH